MVIITNSSKGLLREVWVTQRLSLLPKPLNMVTITKVASLRLLEQLVGSLAGQCLPSALGKDTMNLVNFRSLET